MLTGTASTVQHCCHQTRCHCRTAQVGPAQRPGTDHAALPAGNAEWLDKGKAQCLVYWRKVSALTSLHGASCAHALAAHMCLYAWPTCLRVVHDACIGLPLDDIDPMWCGWLLRRWRSGLM